ncbi:hypothetical protein EII13_01975 [Buchananella hordeovulneris]|nr:hypothetical protein EII13_01975 [Buchananella hordeovulneris]
MVADPVVLMPLPEDPRGALAELVDDVNRLRGRLQATQVWGHVGGGVPGWVGQAADAYTGQITALGGRVREVAAQIGPLAGVIDSVAAAYEQAVDTDIPDLWEEYREVVTHYAGLIDQVHTEVAQRVALSANPTQAVMEAAVEAGRLEEQRDGQLQAIVGRYERLLEGLDETIGQAAGQIGGACEAIAPASVTGRGRAALAQHLFPATDFPLVAAQARWEQADAQAPLIADFLRNRHHSNTDLNEFFDTYGASLRDPFVVTALTRYITPQQLAGFALDLAEEDLTVEGHTGGWGRSKEEMLDLLGTTFVLATGGQNLTDAQTQSLFDLASSALHDRDGNTPTQLTDHFLDRLRDTGAQTHTSPVPAFTGITNFQIFTQLVGYAATNNPELALGPEFYSPADGQQSTASALIEWEHRERNNIQHEIGLSNTLVPLISSADPRLHDPLHALFLASDGPHSTLQAVIDQDADAALGQADPSVQHEYHRRAALRHFLLSDSPLTDPKTGQDISTTRYLTGHRVEQLNSGLTMGFRDGGDAFGRLLAQATAPLPPPEGMNPAQAAAWEEVDKTRAHVAGEFLVGYMDGMDNSTGLSEHNATAYLTKHNFGDQNQALRHWAAHITAPQVEGLAYSLMSDHYPEEGQYVLPTRMQEGQHSLPLLHPNQAARLVVHGGFLSDLARVPVTADPTDPPAPLEVLQNATITGFRRDMEAAFDLPTDQQQPTNLQTAISKWQRLHETIYRAPATNVYNDAVEDFGQDLKIRKLHGKIASLTPLTSGNPLASAAIPFLKQFTSSYLAAPPSTDAMTEASKLLPVAGKDSLQDLTLAFLSRAAEEEVFINNNGDVVTPEDTLIDPATGKLIPFIQQTAEQKAVFQKFLLENTTLSPALVELFDGHLLNQVASTEANEQVNGKTHGQ